MIRFINIKTKSSVYEICGNLVINDNCCSIILPIELRDDVLTIAGGNGELSAIFHKDNIMLTFNKSLIIYIAEVNESAKPSIREVK